MYAVVNSVVNLIPGFSISYLAFFIFLQRNEVGNSPGMEYLGFQRSLAYLSECGIKISTFISDRHTSIAKHMREKLTDIVHYFDLWHLKKSMFEPHCVFFVKHINVQKMQNADVNSITFQRCRSCCQQLQRRVDVKQSQNGSDHALTICTGVQRQLQVEVEE